MNHQPLVTVICLCYNQEKFVKRSIDSVLNQTYPNIQLIVVDDGSTDQSKCEIKKALQSHPDVGFIDLEANLGNTSAFNKGLEVSEGEFIIDLAADDMLNADRVELQVSFFLEQPQNVGVIYSDAQYIDANGRKRSVHFANTRYRPYEGDIYYKLIDCFFIPPPTMMIRKEVLDQLNGYDESLAYEDYDFWIRSSRDWHYAYQPQVLTKITKHHGSHSTGWYQRGDKQLYSTYKVCKKIRTLNRSNEEHEALLNRVKFEIRQSVFSGNYREAELFLRLLKELGGDNWMYKSISYLNKTRVDLSYVRKMYHAIRFG